MASFMVCFAILFVIAGHSPSAVTAEEFKVGGDGGWRQPAASETEMYSQWAQTMKFHVGDSLCFEYKNDSVMVVNKYGYYHCNSTHPTSVLFKDGYTVIKLERPAPAYFVSGDPDHCKNGQRLTVEVHPISRSPPLASPAPSPYSGVGPFFVMPHLVLFYVTFIAASINM